MHPVGNERRDWSEQTTCHHQHFVQRRESGAIVGAVHVVKAVTVETHVPVGKVINKAIERIATKQQAAPAALKQAQAEKA